MSSDFQTLKRKHHEHLQNVKSLYPMTVKVQKNILKHYAFLLEEKSFTNTIAIHSEFLNDVVLLENKIFKCMNFQYKYSDIGHVLDPAPSTFSPFHNLNKRAGFFFFALCT